MEITDLNHARKLFSLIENLEDQDDVQEVFANFTVPAEIQNELEKL